MGSLLGTNSNDIPQNRVADSLMITVTNTTAGSHSLSLMYMIPIITATP